MTHIYNPKDRPVEELPFVYGFNNGGGRGFLSAVAMAEDGTVFAGHICSNEGYMVGDLGFADYGFIDKRKVYDTHYPDGYRTEFIRNADVPDHAGLMTAIEKNKQQAASQAEDKA